MTYQPRNWEFRQEIRLCSKKIKEKKKHHPPLDFSPTGYMKWWCSTPVCLNDIKGPAFFHKMELLWEPSWAACACAFLSTITSHLPLGRPNLHWHVVLNQHMQSKASKASLKDCFFSFFFSWWNDNANGSTVPLTSWRKTEVSLQGMPVGQTKDQKRMWL